MLKGKFKNFKEETQNAQENAVLSYLKYVIGQACFVCLQM